MAVFDVNVVGTTFEGRQDVLKEMHLQRWRGKSLRGRLRREPDNPYDTNAVAVDLTGDSGSGKTWHHVGYIPKALAAKLAERMDGGEELRVMSVQIVGGEVDKPTYGVHIVADTKDKEDGVSG